MTTELTRRTLLAGAVVAAGGGSWWLWKSRSPRELAALAALVEELGLPPQSEDLGEAYLAEHPDESDSERLAELLLPVGTEPGRDELRSRLAERIARDWIELDVVQLDGWILARSEGRLLALKKLLAAEVSSDPG